MKFFSRNKPDAKARDDAPAPDAVDTANAEQAAPAEPAAVEQPALRPGEKKAGFFARLKRGLGRTSNSFVEGLGTVMLGRKEIDANLLEDLESQLLVPMSGLKPRWKSSDA